MFKNVIRWVMYLQKWLMIRSQDSLYLTYSRILAVLPWLVTRICQNFYLIASFEADNA